MSKKRCIVCGSDVRPLNLHEPPGRAVSKQVQVWVCDQPCHKYLTERQRVAGFVLGRRQERPGYLRQYQFLSGASQVLGVCPAIRLISLPHREGVLRTRR